MGGACCVSKKSVRFLLEPNNRTAVPNAVQVDKCSAEEEAPIHRKIMYGFVKSGLVNWHAVPADFAEGDWVSYIQHEDKAENFVHLQTHQPWTGTVQMCMSQKYRLLFFYSFLPSCPGLIIMYVLHIRYGFILPDGVTSLIDADGNRTTLFFSGERVKNHEVCVCSPCLLLVESHTCWAGVINRSWRAETGCGM